MTQQNESRPSPEPRALARAERSDTRRRALSMFEAAISVVVVGGMLVAALNAAGAARINAFKTADRATGTLLAQQLMSEIVQQAYADPNPVIRIFGPELINLNGTRAAFDDVDDYDGWTASPPQYQDGTDIVGMQNWTRSVTVRLARPKALDQTPATDVGLKHITVTVKHYSMVTAQLIAVRTDMILTTPEVP